MSENFKVLSYDETPLGLLCLRQRLTLSEPQCLVTEVTLDHEFLMSSMHTDSECALAEHAINRLSGDDLRILVGGLGLGYTTAAALRSERVTHVEVIEFLPQVIKWMQSGLIPLSDLLRNDDRVAVVQSDVYRFLLNEPGARRWNAILIDVDHSPEDQLSTSDHGFYSQRGLSLAARHLCPGGVMALWSYEDNSSLEITMRTVFSDVEVLPVTYENRHVGELFTDWLFFGRLE